MYDGEKYFLLKTIKSIPASLKSDRSSAHCIWDAFRRGFAPVSAYSGISSAQNNVVCNACIASTDYDIIMWWLLFSSRRHSPVSFQSETFIHRARQ